MTSFEGSLDARADDQQQPDQLVVTIMFAPPRATTLAQGRVLAAEAAVSRMLTGTQMAEPLGFESNDDGPLMFRYRVSPGHQPQVVRSVVEATCALLDVPHTVGLEDEGATLPPLVLEAALDGDDDDPRDPRDADWQAPPFPFDAPPL